MYLRLRCPARVENILLTQCSVLICYFLFVSIGSYAMAYLNYLVIEVCILFVCGVKLRNGS